MKIKIDIVKGEQKLSYCVTAQIFLSMRVNDFF